MSFADSIFSFDFMALTRESSRAPSPNSDEEANNQAQDLFQPNFENKV